MKNFPKHKTGFSLVELMISLITISCIAAAFTPVITKKLKKQDIALSIAQTSEITTKCHKGEAYPFGNDTDGYKCELCTKTYCINCELTCPDTKYVDPQSCTCKSCSKYTTNCEKCDKDTCIKCKAGKNGYYIKNKSCEQCTAQTGGIYSDGVKCTPECSAPDGYYCANDGTVKLCTTKFDARCEKCTESVCTKCGMGSYVRNGNCEPCIAGSGCVDCGTDGKCILCHEPSGYLVQQSDGTCVKANNFDPASPYVPFCNVYSSKGGVKPASTTDYKCIMCYGGYYATNNGMTCSTCNSIQDADSSNHNCVECDNSGCILCNEGFKPNKNGRCFRCNLANCAACASSTECEVCVQGYHLDNNKTCVPDKQTFNCSDSNFIKVGNLCITRKNMGDSKVLTIPSSVNYVDKGETCYASVDNCCWKTELVDGTSCDNKYGSYSGCKRTACNWPGANEACAKFNYAGKKWRLPSTDEVRTWYKYTAGLGGQGIDLCDIGNQTGSNWCSPDGGSCYGAYGGGTCWPDFIWNSNQTKVGVTMLATMLEYGTYLTNLEYNRAYAFSVRCVTEMDD